MRIEQPTLLPAEFCDGCPLEDCVERDTDAACRSGRLQESELHPGNWSVFEQRIAWAPSAVGIRARLALPALPPYVTRVPREVDPSALASLPTTAVAISLRDFMLLTHAHGAGPSLRERLRLGVRKLVVIGADPDRVCDAHWEDWPTVLSRLTNDPPDLVVGPDLSFYQDDPPARLRLNFNSHTVMYTGLVKLGLAALVPFGWVYQSDVSRFVAWAREFDVPGAFLDLQRRTTTSAFDALAADLRTTSRRVPPGFTWLVNGVQRPARMRVLHDILGDVRFTSAGPWQEARNQRIFIVDSLAKERTTLNVTEAFAQSVVAMTAAAQKFRPLAHKSRHRTLTPRLATSLRTQHPAGMTRTR